MIGCLPGWALSVNLSVRRHALQIFRKHEANRILIVTTGDKVNKIIDRCPWVLQTASANMGIWGVATKYHKEGGAETAKGPALSIADPLCFSGDMSCQCRQAGTGRRQRRHSETVPSEHHLSRILKGSLCCLADFIRCERL